MWQKHKWEKKLNLVPDLIQFSVRGYLVKKEEMSLQHKVKSIKSQDWIEPDEQYVVRSRYRM